MASLREAFIKKILLKYLSKGGTSLIFGFYTALAPQKVT